MRCISAVIVVLSRCQHIGDRSSEEQTRVAEVLERLLSAIRIREVVDSRIEYSGILMFRSERSHILPQYRLRKFENEPHFLVPRERRRCVTDLFLSCLK